MSDNFFEKVSLMQFAKAYEVSGESVYHNYVELHLPDRSTKYSAGYDFYAPVDIEVKAGEYVVVPTGIRCHIPENTALLMYPRSSLGFKYGMRFANTIPVVDSDYYYADNEGHIMLKFTAEKDFIINAGDRFAQGIITPFMVDCSEVRTENRTGGIGSTGK